MHDQNRAKLKLVNQYIIAFKSLKDGNHEFEFDFDKKFFDEYEILEARDGKIKANVLLHKNPTFIKITANMKGFMEVRCDRCLDFFKIDIDYSGDVIIKFGAADDGSSDEIWILHPDDHEIDLKQHFFECIELSLPLKKTHPADDNGKAGCDPEMLHILKTHTSTSEKPEELDPRWTKLNDLLNDKN